MNVLDPMFLLLVSSGLLYVVTGTVLYKRPPKEINQVYGYRSPSSMESQERWEFAQTTAAIEKIKAGVIMWLCASIGQYLQLPEAISVFAGLGIMILISVMPPFVTEKALYGEFGPIEESSQNNQE